ncbi:HlyD family secretion protein [Microvirga thermotolerans]|uniref:HlyD family efflux transporter periplasmic adaptor subunit n=1 Tax=Microvirga thermotolerans TaxID=2651334 RepID=A0A5P9JY96_9HYPH|nr:HlyD family secretion protein [Microvirga thermotolerans]QFU16215.1 HlyD family efflux transporter periplasmic adaptor subunit [Microvirga thermotolerans]
MAYRDDDTRSKGEGPSPQADRAPRPAPEAEGAAAVPQGTGAPEGKSQSRKKARFGKKPVLLAVLLAGLGFGGYEGYHWWTVGRFTVSTDDAYVQADITILSAKVSGYVSSVAVSNNQSVKAGDLIAKIDDGDYRLALQAAKDKLATQQSAVARIGQQIEAARASVAQAEAQVAAAKAEAERAAGDFARQQQLAQSNYASKATFENAKAERDRADANVKSAQAALALAQANVDVLAAQRAEAQRAVAEQQTAVEKAERDISFTEIRAPVDGVIGNKAVEVGTFVQPGARLAAIVPLDSVHVDANFKETQLAALRPGQKVHLTVDAYPEADIVGTVESVAPASGAVFSLLPPENATGNFTKIVQRVPVRIEVSEEAARTGMLRPGLSVVVSVNTREQAEPRQTTQAARR